jgi:hypothetical protein
MIIFFLFCIIFSHGLYCIPSYSILYHFPFSCTLGQHEFVQLINLVSLHTLFVCNTDLVALLSINRQILCISIGSLLASLKNKISGVINYFVRKDILHP